MEEDSLDTGAEEWWLSGASIFSAASQVRGSLGQQWVSGVVALGRQARPQLSLLKGGNSHK